MNKKKKKKENWDNCLFSNAIDKTFFKIIKVVDYE